MTAYRLAYNTNGLAHHRLDEAIDVLADLGYEGVAITPDVGHLDFASPNFTSQLTRVRRRLEHHRLDVVIESGARFQLDPRRKHYPSLLCRDDRVHRIEFLGRCIDLAAELGAPVVSLWAGHDFENLGADAGFDLLVDGMGQVLARAEQAGVDIGFEPEPGMFVETMADYARLRDHLSSPRFRLALDIGHLLVTQDLEIPDAIRDFRDDLATLTVEDMKRGVHDHLAFGDGDVDFAAAFAAIHEIDYDGLVIVELSRHASNAVETARRAMNFLARLRRDD